MSHTMDLVAALKGHTIDQVDTPVPLVDLDLFDHNARTINAALAEHGQHWRPHTKAHKSPYLAARQIELGAIGVTCAKVSEAEVMAGAGIDNILVANMVGTFAKWRRVAALQSQAKVTVCVDDPQHVQWAAKAAGERGVTIGVLVEVDIGMDRVGVRSNDQAVALAALIAQTDGVHLAGMMGYEGHLPTVWPAHEKHLKVQAALTRLLDAVAAVRDSGMAVDIVSSGGTGTYQESFGLTGLTESQAGGGCLMDRFYAESCHVDLLPSLSLVATVVSAHDGVAITDAGFKAMGTPTGMLPALVLDRPGVSVRALSAEHGILSSTGEPLRVGDRVRLMPAYSDAMIYLHDYVIGHRDGVVTDVIEVAGRGRLF